MDAAEGPLSANSLIIDHLMMEQLTTLVVARLTNVFQRPCHVGGGLAVTDL